MAEFKDRLTEAMKMAGTSAAELARRTGLTEGAISCYKKGSYKAGQETIQKLAWTLNVSIPWLMGLDADVMPSDAEKSQLELAVIRDWRKLPVDQQLLVYGYIQGLLSSNKRK